MSESIDLALEEKLDALDPLRHLRNDDEQDIVPLQPPSVLNQTVELTFPTTACPPNSIVVRLSVDASPGCGGIVWPAGEVSSNRVLIFAAASNQRSDQVLSRYIARRGPLEGKCILELGSGTGLVGLVAGKLGATAYITDQACVALYPTGRCDIDACTRLQPPVGKHGPQRPYERSRPIRQCPGAELVLVLTIVSMLRFSLQPTRGEPLPTDIPPFDLILAADCVYFEPAFPLLVQTLDQLATRGDPEILFCYRKRRKVSVLITFAYILLTSHEGR